MAVQDVICSSFVPINYTIPPGGNNGFAYTDPRTCAWGSGHPGGANFVFADGHVEFLDEEIGFNQIGATATDDATKVSMGVYQRLLRRNDGQLIGHY